MLIFANIARELEAIRKGIFDRSIFNIQYPTRNCQPSIVNGGDLVNNIVLFRKNQRKFSIWSLDRTSDLFLISILIFFNHLSRSTILDYDYDVCRMAVWFPRVLLEGLRPRSPLLICSWGQQTPVWLSIPTVISGLLYNKPWLFRSRLESPFLAPNETY